MENPFRLDFGAKPKLYIPRKDGEETIINTFLSKEPSTHLYMIIGARGMGKTVMMTSISQKIEEMDKWIHIDLSSDNTMVDFISELEAKCKSKVPKINISVNIKAIQIEFSSKEAQYSTIKVEINKMHPLKFRQSVNFPSFFRQICCLSISQNVSHKTPKGL